MEPEQSQEEALIVTEKPRFSIGNVLLGVLVGIGLSVGTFFATVNSIAGPEEKESNTIASTGTNFITISLAHSLTHSVAIFENILYDLKYNYVDDVDVTKLFNTGSNRSLLVRVYLLTRFVYF